MPIKTNIVSAKKLREIQLDTLKTISETIAASFGPMGSNTLILKDGALTKYSKDGFTLLKEMKFLGVIEEAVRSDMEDILRNIIKEFGDNSTSASILCYLIFKELVNISDKNEDNPYTIIRNFREAVKNINEVILADASECTPKDIYDIAYTSTNGNDELARYVQAIYEKYPMDVYVDVLTSTGKEFMIKELDGLTLSAGFMDTCFINNKAKNTATIRNPRIYYFEDPIDTPEMAGLFDTIVSNNIINPISNGSRGDIIPTVILCPKFSKDYSSTIEMMVNFMHNNDINNRPPLLIVTNIYDTATVNDIIHICGCPIIKKYIDPNMQKSDIEKGLAPDLSTVCDFFGEAEEVEATSTATKFINPKKMYDIDENGERVESKEFTALIDFLENEIERQKAEAGPTVNEIALLTKRLRALKSNMVELYVGGISPAERDSAKDLLEDAILNCRSAAKHGYGAGANWEGLMASGKLVDETKPNDPLFKYYEVIYSAYVDISCMLYETVYTESDSAAFVEESLEHGCPLNLRTGEFDHKVISSIRSDVAVLDSIARVMTIMFTCNQALLQNPVVNNYEV